MDSPDARTHPSPARIDGRIAAVTLDLHLGDSADDIKVACERLQARGIRATCFVPTVMLGDSRYATMVREIPSFGHEVASHSHMHDQVEVRALMSGRDGDLEFLRTSKAIHEDAFGVAPVSFRSPAWCHLGPHAVEMLVRLEYRVDSSATPQRLGVFSSLPFENVWTFAPRPVTYLAPSLLEVPTSTFLFPAGSPAFSILRSHGSRFLVGALGVETQVLRNRVLCVQFHPHSFNAASTHRYWKPSRVSARSFLPTREGGLMFKHFLRDSDPVSTASTTDAVLRSLRRHRCLTMSEIGAVAGSVSRASTP